MPSAARLAADWKRGGIDGSDDPRLPQGLDHQSPAPRRLALRQ